MHSYHTFLGTSQFFKFKAPLLAPKGAFWDLATMGAGFGA
jgi:hypothetical protein